MQKPTEQFVTKMAYRVGILKKRERRREVTTWTQPKQKDR